MGPNPSVESEQRLNISNFTSSVIINCSSGLVVRGAGPEWDTSLDSPRAHARGGLFFLSFSLFNGEFRDIFKTKVGAQ